MASLNLRRGGMEKVLLLLARELKKLGQQVKIILIYGPVDYGDVLKEYGLDYEMLFPGTIPYFWTNLYHYASHFRKAVRNYQADVVCAFGGQTLIISKFAGFLPLVLSAQNASSLHWRMNRPGYILLRFLERWAISSRGTHVIGCSPSVFTVYKERFRIPDHRLHMIWNTSDVDAFERPYHQIDQQRPKILCVGTLYYQKNFEMALRALATLHDCGIRAHLQFAGDGEDRLVLERTADELGIGNHVTFLGRRTDIANIMGSSDFLWMTSRYEGFALVVVEAMAARLPIVATRVAGLIDAIEDGMTGFLVGLDDWRAMAQVTETAIHDTEARKRLVENAHRTAMTRFHPSNMTKQYLLVLQDIVQNRIVKYNSLISNKD